MNLTLYTTRAGACPCKAYVDAVLLLDSEGHRILSKYYQPPAQSLGEGLALPPGLAPLTAKNPYQTLKQQQVLENGVWDKARRASGVCGGGSF